MSKKDILSPEDPSADLPPSFEVFLSLSSLLDSSSVQSSAWFKFYRGGEWLLSNAPRLLLQTTRLKRNNKPVNPQPADPRPKVIETDREALTNSRRAWSNMKLLVNLTVEELREHLAQECRDLPLHVVGMDRSYLLCLGREAPSDARFWGAVHQALSVMWPLSIFRDAAEQQQVWDGRFFRETFDCTQYPERAQWVNIACALVKYIFHMKLVAQHYIAERSCLLCLVHESRKAKVDHKAQKILQTEERPKATYKYGVLIAAAQEWLPTKWVQKEIDALRRQRLSDSESVCQEAQEVLDEIAKVQVAFGSGPSKQGTAPERKLRRQGSLQASGARRSVRQVVTRLVKQAEEQCTRLLDQKVRWKPGEAWKIAIEGIWERWEKHKKTEHGEEVRKEFVKQINRIGQKK